MSVKQEKNETGTHRR